MTHLPDKTWPVPLNAYRRLRPSSERALRLLRLAYLAGWTAAVIAQDFGLSRGAVSRRLRVHALRAPEKRGAN